MGRRCPSCYKVVKDARGLKRHQFYCNAPEATQSSLRCRDLIQLPEQVRRADSSTCFPQSLDDDLDNLDTIDPFLLMAPGPSLQQTYPSSRMTVSSSTATVIDTYFEIEGGKVAPGQTYPNDTVDLATKRGGHRSITFAPHTSITVPSISDTNSFFPFKDYTEFKISWWLFKSKLSDAELKQLFSIRGWWSELFSFRTVKGWKRVLHQIPCGISDDTIMEADISISVPSSDQIIKYVVRYRSVLNIVRFLISFPPFAPHLTFAPVRLFKDDEREVPIWNEMWTGSWWWNQQKSLPEGATLIPLLLACDKTQLTQHHGDKSSYPVYVTIGNLDKKTRRAQTRPSKILFGFLPIVDKTHHHLVGETAYTYRRNVINAALDVMLRELQSVEAEGIRMRCADNKVRHCFPVIAGFSVDYEEQAFLTGVKSGQHCVTCRIPPSQRENLTPLERYPLRDHQYSQDLIQHIRTVGRKRKRDEGDGVHESTDEHDLKEMAIDDIVSFMWSFRRVNIHEVMHIDILHQCFKGIVHRSLNEWIIRALQHRDGIVQANAAIDDRFRSIPTFSKLKLFPSYSTVTQWSGVEQKALLRQVIPALAPLLPTKMIQFMRAVVDFTLHAQYFSHDAETLSWMEAAIKRIDILKQGFQDYTAFNTGFNIPKLHAITHYLMMIRKFGSADGYDTAMFEACHKFMVKELYPLTNKRASFEQQIFEHNQRAVNMLAMHDLFLSNSEKSPVSGVREDRAQTTMASRPLNLDALGWDLSDVSEHMRITRNMRFVPSRKQLPHIRCSPRYWRQASTVARVTNQPGFLDALAVFVREERRRARGERSTNFALNRKEDDCSWVGDYLVCIHPSISCWKNDRDDGTNADVRVKEFVRCDPRWQRKGQWRHDYVWVQEYPDADDHQRYPLQGRLPAQMLVILSVLDLQCPQTTRKAPVKASVYTGAFLDVYSLRDQGRQNSRHGMIEARRHVHVVSSSLRSLGHRRFYHLGLIQRSAHLVPSLDDESEVYYINSYIDWDQYSTVYDPDFLSKDLAIAQSIAKQHKWVKRS